MNTYENYQTRECNTTIYRYTVEVGKITSDKSHTESEGRQMKAHYSLYHNLRSCYPSFLWHKFISPTQSTMGDNNPDIYIGKWTEQECKQFEEGVSEHGWGNCTAVNEIIPTRNRRQIKSHGQKFQLHYPDEKRKLVMMYIELRHKLRAFYFRGEFSMLDFLPMKTVWMPRVLEKVPS